MSALEGLKVLDLSNYVPGALCTMILGDFGADVIKVEPAEPFPYEDMGYSSKGEEKRKKTAYFALNRNKKSIGINLRSEAGQQVFYRMAKEADVIIEGYRPGVVKRLKIDYDTIKAINPRVIYCSLSGYGQDGPYRLYPGHDINYISLAGILGLLGPKEGRPSIPLNLIADFAGVSLYGTVAILLALMVRDKTGKGQYLDHTYMEGALHLLIWFTQEYFYRGTVMRRGESWALGGYPHYDTYKTKDDKLISIGCLEPHFWDNLCKALGREDLMPYKWGMEMTFCAPDGKLQEIREDLQKIFLTKTRDEWFDLLIQQDVPIGKVYAIDEVFEDPQIKARQMVIDVEDQKFGKIRQVGILPKLSVMPGTVRRLAPLHGDQTDEILKALGYSPDEIQKMRQGRVVG